jgi:hypothetical protein
VYAGTDPLTRQEIRLRSTVKGELQAQIVNTVSDLPKGYGQPDGAPPFGRVFAMVKP